MTILQRIFGNWRTTIGGTAVGAGLMAMVAMILSQSGCNFSNIQWAEVLALVFTGPTVVGAMATDNKQGV